MNVEIKTNGPSYVIVPMKCPKCKVEFNTLLSAGGNNYCERCHMQTLYDRVKKIEKKLERRKK